MAITVEQRKDLIEMYVAIPGRAPDASGLAFWANGLGNGETFETIAQQMWDSPETQAQYPASLTVEETVTAIYENVLGREPDAEGLAYWVTRWNANIAEGNGEAATLLEMIDVITSYEDGQYGDAELDALAAESKALFEAKVEFGEYFALELKSDDLDLAEAGFDVLEAGGTVEEAIAAVNLDDAETVILTAGTDVETTGNNDDRFLATDSTLN